MTPTRMVVRAIGFFLIPITILAVTYPLLQKGIHIGKEQFLDKQHSREDLKQIAQRNSFLSTLPIRLYFAQVYRSCREERKRLCPESADSEDSTRCLLDQISQVVEMDCRQWLVVNK